MPPPLCRRALHTIPGTPPYLQSPTQIPPSLLCSPRHVSWICAETVSMVSRRSLWPRRGPSVQGCMSRQVDGALCPSAAHHLARCPGPGRTATPPQALPALVG